MGIGSAHHLLQIRKREQSDESHGVGSHHAERRELVFLIVVVGHHAQQRAVGHVHCGVNSHHQQIERISIDALAHRTEVGRIEQQGEDKSQGDRTEDEPGPVGAPTRLSAVGQAAHQRVGDHIEHACHEHQCGRVGYGETKNISKKQRKCYRHDFPGDASCGCITQRISYLLF